MAETAPPLMVMNARTLERFEIGGSPILRPESVEESVDVGFNDVRPFGLSHAHQQYVGTSNRGMSLTFRIVVRTTADLSVAREFERFCWSMAYPTDDVGPVLANGPDLLVVAWPNVMSGVFRVRNVRVVRRLFNTAGDTVEGDIVLTLSEHLERRFTAEMARQAGSSRTRIV